MGHADSVTAAQFRQATGKLVAGLRPDSAQVPKVGSVKRLTLAVAMWPPWQPKPEPGGGCGVGRFPSTRSDHYFIIGIPLKSSVCFSN